MISNEKLEQWRALADAATQGPWTAKARSTDGNVDWFLGAEIEELEQPERGQFVNMGDAAFIAAAREAVPALLDEVDRLRAELAGYKRHAAYVAGVVESDGRYIP